MSAGVHGLRSQAHPVGDQPPRRGAASQTDQTVWHIRKFKKADVIGLDLNDASVDGFHVDFSGPGGDDLADNAVGNHLQLQRQ